MKNILLVEDSENFRAVLKLILENEDYVITEAEDGKAAQNILLSGAKIDLIISDVSMPHVSGIELFQWVKENKPCPFILMTGFAEILETKTASSLGVDDFLTKPFEPEDVLTAIAKVESASGKPKKLNFDHRFCKIPIESFITGHQIAYNIFIRISESSYVKIANQGENLSLDRIQAYRSKGVDYLYLTRDDFRKYLGFTIKLVKASKKTRIAPEKRNEFVKQTGELLLQTVYVAGLDEESMKQSREFVEVVNDLIFDTPQLFNLLDLLNTHSDHLYAHCLGVSLYSVLIARQLKWSSPQTLTKLSIAGLFHDIGKKEIDPRILNKPRKDLNQQEVKLYESHVNRGVQILGTVDVFPSDVIQIIQHHHEQGSGYGYPQGLKKTKIHPLARLLSVADIFCKIALKGPEGPGKPGLEAIKQMLLVHKDELDPTPFVGLIQLFKSEIPGDLGR